MSDCNDKDSLTVTMDAIINVIKHLKPESDGSDGLSTDYFINGSPYYLNIYFPYLHVWYLIVLYPLHFQSLLWFLFRRDPTKI